MSQRSRLSKEDFFFQLADRKIARDRNLCFCCGSPRKTGQVHCDSCHAQYLAFYHSTTSFQTMLAFPDRDQDLELQQPEPFLDRGDALEISRTPGERLEKTECVFLLVKGVDLAGDHRDSSAILLGQLDFLGTKSSGDRITDAWAVFSVERGRAESVAQLLGEKSIKTRIRKSVRDIQPVPVMEPGPGKDDGSGIARVPGETVNEIQVIVPRLVQCECQQVFDPWKTGDYLDERGQASTIQCPGCRVVYYFNQERGSWWNGRRALLFPKNQPEILKREPGPAPGKELAKPARRASKSSSAGLSSFFGKQER